MLTEDIESKETQVPEGAVENAAPVVLTERDLAVMQFAHEQRYLCYNQISDTFWKGML